MRYVNDEAQSMHAQHVKRAAVRHVADESLVFACATYQKSWYVICERRGSSLRMRNTPKELLCDMWQTKAQSTYAQHA